MPEISDTTPGPPTRTISPLLVPLAAGAAVAVALGVYGQVHDPTGRSLYTLFFTSTIRLKSWFATAAVVLALGQVTSAAWLYGRVPRMRSAPGWLGDLHRLSGTIAFAVSLPVAYHCLWSLGYQTYTTRVAVHSLLGCAAYGAIAAKVTAVRRPDQPPWLLPVLGSVVAVLLAAIWWTSSLWYFRNVTWSI